MPLDDSTLIRELGRHAISKPDAIASNRSSSLLRSATRFLVAEGPSSDEICAFGRALPRSMVTLIISTDARWARAHHAAERTCLPNRERINARRKPDYVSDLSLDERRRFGTANLAKLTLGEIAIHLSHGRALDQCEQRLQSGGRFRSCLILEGDFVLTGPRPARRWAANYEALPKDWQARAPAFTPCALSAPRRRSHPCSAHPEPSHPLAAPSTWQVP